MKTIASIKRGLGCSAALLCLTQAGAQTIDLNFDKPGDFTNNFYIFVQAGDNNANNQTILPTDPLNTQYAESTSAGIGGGGALALYGGDDRTAVYHGRSFDFSTNGAIISASVFYKLIAASGGARPIQLGFINDTNSSMNNNTGSAFMSARPNNQGGLSTSAIFHLQTKTADGGTAGPTMSDTLTLTEGHWYKLTVNFKNIKDTVADSYEESGTLEDYGTDGKTLVAGVYQIPATQIANADMTSDDSVWPAFRGFSTGGASAYDNFSAGIPDVSKAPPSIVNLAPGDGKPFSPATDGLAFNVTTVAPNAIPASKISLFLNGVDVTAGLSVTGTSVNRAVTYKGLAPDTFYQAQIVASDDAGRATTNRWSFDTFSENLFTIEAEDFNFDGGKFIDNPTPGAVEGPTSYVNKVGMPNVDEYDPTEGGATHAYRGTDAATGATEIVGTEAIGAAEYTRKKFTDAGAQDYDVGWVDVGEWWNYTRTFPVGAYKVYARLASGNTGVLIAQLDQVAGNTATASQMAAAMGRFTHATTGDWQRYVTVPLRDVLDNEVVMRANGKATLRFTTVANGLNANYFVFLPVANPGTLAPYVSSASPMPNATGVSLEGRIQIAIFDRDTKVQLNSVKLSFNGVDVTAQASIAGTDTGAAIGYLSPVFLAQGSTNSITLVFSDGATPANAVSNSWSFVAAKGVPVVPAAWAQAAGSGQTSGFTVRASQQNNDAANTTARTENQLAGGLLPLVTQGFDTPQVINYWGNGANTNFTHDTPNFPGVDDTVNAANIALETVAYLALNRGIYRFGATSDDGFRATIGKEAHAIVTDPTNAVVLLDQIGYTAGDRTFTFVVETNGLYPFRLTYEQGAGGYELELFSFDANGSRVLINDPANPNAIKAYRFCSAFPASAVTFTQQPSNQTARVNSAVTLRTRISTANSLLTNTYQAYLQWQKDGQDIAGANGPDLSFPLVSQGDAGKYRCNVTVLGYPTVTSAQATLTVTDDNVPPTITAVKAGNSSATLVITFSETVEAGSATQPGNYTLDGGVTVTEAVLDASGLSVTLTTSPQTVGTKYSVVVNGVADLSGNTIAADSKASFTSYAPQALIAANVTGSEFLDILFNGEMDPETATNIANYTLTRGTITNIVLAEASGAVVLRVTGISGTDNTVAIKGVKDVSGNVLNTNLPVMVPLYAVNFQTGTAPLPAGYLKDDGSVFGDRGNGLTYGWDVNNTANSRLRNNAGSPDIRYDTFNHMMKPLPAGRVWQMSLPNGTYTVYAAEGDITATDSKFGVDVQGVLTLSGAPSTTAHFVSGVSTVTVTDGKLTVTNHKESASLAEAQQSDGSWNNKINFIEIFGQAIPAVNPPKLSVSRAAGSLSIAWPTEGAAGFALEATDSLSAPNWAAINAAVVPAGTNSTVTVPIGTGTQFFRLRK